VREIAQAGGARRLVLTHLPPGADRARARSLAAEPLSGAVDVAAQGRTFEVGPDGMPSVTGSV
jgi:hypothetical protein